MSARTNTGSGEKRRLSNFAVGVIFAALLAIGSYLAYTKELPFAQHHEVQAVFSNAQSVRGGEPVRVAGVKIGEVSGVEHLPASEDATELAANATDVPSDELPADAAIVTIRLNDDAPVLRDDTRIKLRPRLFLEGNYFVDVKPGSPSGEPVDEDHVFGLEHTSSTVNLDTIFTTLQSDVRTNLQVLLEEFGGALIDHGGADGLNELNRTAPGAYRYTSQFNQAFLGTEKADLRGTLRGFNRLFRGLSRNEQALAGFVVNLRTVSGSFAAEDRALGAAVEQLPATLRAAEPAYDNLNAAFPALRAFAREALPGVRSSPSSLRAATPFIAQVRKLVSRDELRGLLTELKPTVPELAKLAERNIDFFEQSRALSSCFNEVIVPWSNSTVEPIDPGNLYPHTPNGRTFEMTGYSLSGSNGENRSADGNGHFVRTLGGSGSNIVRVPSADGLRDDAFALTPFPLLGAMPRIDDSARTPFRPEEPCEEQEPPNLEAGISPPPDQEPAPTAGTGGLPVLAGPGANRLRARAKTMNELARVESLRAAGRNRDANRLVREAQDAMRDLGFSEAHVEAVGEEYR